MFKRKNNFVYGGSQTIDSNSFPLYSPHPFTNWSLNPYYKIGKEFQHTSEGFRRVDDNLSTRSNWSHSDFTVYAMGGSTTYCTELMSYRFSWPSLLNKRSGLTVCNAGVGGWGSLQSFIRFSVWGPILKPKLTIVYLSKNDLTPFLNGRKEEENVYPLYENIMLQMSSKIKLVTRHTDLSSLYSSKNNRLSSLYSLRSNRSVDGLSRFTQEHILATQTRFQMISDLVEQWNGGVLFIPEIIKKDSIYFTKMQKIHKIMEEVNSNNNNTDFFDVRKFLDYRKEYFLDKMHFNEKGCQIFAQLIGNYLEKEYIKK
jgi:hypothetical protein